MLHPRQASSSPIFHYTSICLPSHRQYCSHPRQPPLAHCLTSVIYTGQVGCSRGRPLFRSYGPVGYLCGGLRPPPLLGSFFTPTLPILHFVLYMVRYGIDLEFLRSRIWWRDSNSDMPAGFFSGALIPLIVCPEKEVIGIWLSMAQSVSSLANLSGPPIAGSCFSSAPGEVTVI
jgi:hypothetical protein